MNELLLAHTLSGALDIALDNQEALNAGCEALRLCGYGPIDPVSYRESVEAFASGALTKALDQAKGNWRPLQVYFPLDAMPTLVARVADLLCEYEDCDALPDDFAKRLLAAIGQKVAA